MMTPPTQRLVITLEDGCISGIYADGVDLSGVTAIVVDYDVEGSDDEDLIPVGDVDAWFTPRDIEPADDELSRDIRPAYHSWAMS